MHQGEDMIGDATGIRAVYPEIERAVVMQQTIEYVPGFAGGGGDHRDVERRVAIRDVGIELDGGIAAVVGVDFTAASPAPPRWKCWPSEVAPVPTPNQTGQRLPVLGFDQARQSGPVGFLPRVPGGDPEELPACRDCAHLSHARQPQIVRLADQVRQEGAPVAWRPAGLDMSEVPGQVGPAIDLLEQIRDPDLRHHAVKAVGKPVRFGHLVGAGATQFQLAALQGDAVRRSRLEQPGGVPQAAVEQLHPLREIASTVTYGGAGRRVIAAGRGAGTDTGARYSSRDRYNREPWTQMSPARNRSRSSKRTHSS